MLLFHYSWIVLDSHILWGSTFYWCRNRIFLFIFRQIFYVWILWWQHLILRKRSCQWKYRNMFSGVFPVIFFRIFGFKFSRRLLDTLGRVLTLRNFYIIFFWFYLDWRNHLILKCKPTLYFEIFLQLLKFPLSLFNLTCVLFNLRVYWRLFARCFVRFSRNVFWFVV